MIKVIGFDVGHTLIEYKNPLNWASLYPKALERVSKDCNISLTEHMFSKAIDILTKYNTRINYREYEVSSDTIFNEIISSWSLGVVDIKMVKYAFYSFFQSNAQPFFDVIETLKMLKGKGVKIAILTDVAYGMDNEFSLKDIEMLNEYIDLTLTSVDVGFRKPNKSGYDKIIQYFKISPNEMMFVGDEEKDIVGANNVGAISVLIDRTNNDKLFNQDYSISSMNEIIHICNSTK